MHFWISTAPPVMFSNLSHVCSPLWHSCSIASHVSVWSKENRILLSSTKLGIHCCTASMRCAGSVIVHPAKNCLNASNSVTLWLCQFVMPPPFHCPCPIGNVRKRGNLGNIILMTINAYQLHIGTEQPFLSQDPLCFPIDNRGLHHTLPTFGKNYERSKATSKYQNYGAHPNQTTKMKP